MSDTTRTFPPDSDPTRTDLPASTVPSNPGGGQAPTGADDTKPTATRHGITDPMPETVGEPPSAIQGFEIERELGRGGMGIVFLARQTALNRHVALKMILAGGRARPEEIIRFLSEAEAIAALQHPRIVQIFETGQVGGLPYLALEYLPGGSLTDRAREAPLDHREAAHLIAELADGIAYAHSRGVVHRDLKPENVLFAADGTPRITDFGLAKRVEAGDGITVTGAVMGTPGYISPEQARGRKNIGPPADVYSLGAILYRLICGRPPFQAPSAWETIHQVIADEPVPPRRLLPTVPRDLNTVCLRCLEKDPARRYAGAAALAADLRRFLAGEPVEARPVGTAERVAKWARRNPLAAGLVAALAAVFILGFAGVTWGLVRAELRGRDLDQANNNLKQSNDSLSRSYDDLAKANTDLTKSRDDLATAEGVAAKRANEAEQSGYYSDIALAQQLYRANDLRGMRQALDRCPPALRKWEWDYLDQLARPTLEVIPSGPAVVALAYSPNRRMLGYLIQGKEFVVRDVPAGRDVLRLPVAPGSYHLGAIAFDPAGKRVAFITGKTTRLVELPGGKVLAEYTLPDRVEDRALGFAKNGELLVVRVSEDHENRMKPTVVRVINLVTNAERAAVELPAAEAWVCAGAALSPDGAHFAVLFANTQFSVIIPEGLPVPPVLKVFDVATGKLIRQADAGSDQLAAPVFSPDGRFVAFGRSGPFVGELDLTTNDPPRVFPGPPPGIRVYGYTAGGLLLAGGSDGVVRARDRITTAEAFVWRGAPGPIRALALTPDGREAASGTGDPFGGVGGLVRWSGANPEALVRRCWPGAEKRMGQVYAISADARRFVTSDVGLTGRPPNQHRLHIGETGSDRDFDIDPAGIQIACFLPDGTLAYQTRDSFASLRLIDTAGRQIGELPTGLTKESHFYPSAVVCSRDGKTLALVSINYRADSPEKPGSTQLRVATWNLAARNSPPADHVATITEFANETGGFSEVGAVEFDREGKRLAIPMHVSAKTIGAERPGVLFVWDIATGAITLRKDSPFPLYSAGFDASDRPTAAGGTRTEGRVIAWEANGREAWAVRGHTGPILGLGFGPGGRMVTGGEDRSVKVWDVASGRELLTLTGHTRRVTHVGFSTNGGAIYSATGYRETGSMDLNTLASEMSIPAEVRIWGGERPNAPALPTSPPPR